MSVDVYFKREYLIIVFLTSVLIQSCLFTFLWLLWVKHLIQAPKKYTEKTEKQQDQPHPIE